jgi:hypothetical protein
LTRRKAIPVPTKLAVLHEAGYKCSNPACRTVLTLDIHHLDYVKDGGGNTVENLLALCPNCHSLHHQSHIPRESLRAWKMLLLALNEGFDKRSVDVLLALDELKGIMLWGDGLLGCAALIASGLVTVEKKHEVVDRNGLFGSYIEHRIQKYWVELSAKGQLFIEAWKRGDQNAAVQAWSGSNKALHRTRQKAARR